MSSPATYIQNGLSFFELKEEKVIIPMIVKDDDKVVIPLMKNIMKYVQRCNRLANKFLSIPLKKCINLCENSQKVREFVGKLTKSDICFYYRFSFET